MKKKLIIGILILIVTIISLSIPVIPSSNSVNADATNGGQVCILCGNELQPEFTTDKDGKQYMNEAHSSIWIHNPRNLHEDIKVTIHQSCYDTAKKVSPNFDIPTQNDYADYKVPFIGADKSVSTVKISVTEWAKRIVDHEKVSK